MGAKVHMEDKSYMVQRGLLIIIGGQCGAHFTLLSIFGVRDTVVFVSPLPCKHLQSRQVHFANE